MTTDKTSGEAGAVAARIAEEDAYLVPYLLGWAGKGKPQPWGAATSFALEMADGYGLIRGECDATLTQFGRAVVDALPPLSNKDNTDATE